MMTQATGKPSTFRVGLVQINNSFSNQNYLPYSVGILQAYAMTHLARPAAFEFMLPLYRRMPVDDATASLSGADAVFFSTYVWNVRLSLEIARRPANSWRSRRGRRRGFGNRRKSYARPTVPSCRPRPRSFDRSASTPSEPWPAVSSTTSTTP